MDQLRHGLLTLAVLVLGAASSCQFLFPPMMMIVGSGPAAGRYSSAAGLSVWVEFSQSLPHGSAEKGIALKENGTTMGARFEWSGNRVTVIPDAGLSLGNRYDLTVAGTVKDDQGIDLESDFTLTFYTRLNDIRPQAAVLPANGTTTTDVFQPVTVNFSKSVNRTSFYNNLSLSPPYTAAYSWGTDDLSCVITPLTALTTPAVYTVKIGASTSDTEGNTLGADVSSWFSEGTTGVGPAPIRAVKTVSVGGIHTPDSTYLLSPVDLPSGTVAYNTGFERTWGLAVVFDRSVQRSGLDSLITVDPAWSFSIPYTSTGVTQVQLVPGAPLAYGTLYTLTVHRGVTDLQGNPSTTDTLYRFKVDGPGSVPPSLQSIRFNTNLASPTTDTVWGDHSTDYQSLHVSAFSNVASSTSVDLTFLVASGANIDAASVMSHFSMTATDANTVAAVTAVGLPSPMGSSPQTVRVTVQITRGGSGLLVFKLAQGLVDSLGNATAADQSWPVLE